MKAVLNRHWDEKGEQQRILKKRNTILENDGRNRLIWDQNFTNYKKFRENSFREYQNRRNQSLNEYNFCYYTKFYSEISKDYLKRQNSIKLFDYCVN